MLKSVLTTAVIGLIGIGTLGCETNTGNGALLGGAGGALVGAGVGSLSHARAGEGALLGGALGAIGGAVVGNEADKHDRPYYGGGSYDRGYDGPIRYEEREYGYEQPSPRYYRYSRTYEAPRRYYEVRTYRTYGRGPRRYSETYYRYD